MSERMDKILADGLLAGFVGRSQFSKVNREGFIGESSSYVDHKFRVYHDEWFANDNGGGQELVRVDNEEFTRLYGGGVISTEELEKIGVTTQDVIKKYLIPAVRELKGRTRLHKPAEFNFGNGWNYKYSILKKSEEVPLTVGYESIEYNGREVFAHAHILSPVK